jgi:glutamate synthase (NADPH/NADH) large chain
MLDDMDDTVARFVKVLPRDYAAVIETRQTAVAEGLDPDGDVVWGRIMEVTGG